MNLDELLLVVPGLKRVRCLNASWLRTLLDRRKGECTWCGKPVPKGCQTWCSPECVAAFQERCDSAAQARLVEQRDAWTCQQCGRDTKLAKQNGLRAAEEVAKAFGVGRYGKESREAQHAAMQQHGWERGHWYEVDHIVPVVEGGGLMGIANLRLLCGVCHAEATRQLAKRRSAAKQYPPE